MRRLLAAVALAILGSLFVAPQAEAACTVSGYSNTSAYTSAGHEVRVKTFWVDCGTYKRLQSAKWYMPTNASAHSVELRYWDGRGYVYSLVNSTKTNTATVNLGNVTCYDTCGIRHAGNLWVGYTDIISYPYTKSGGL